MNNVFSACNTGWAVFSVQGGGWILEKSYKDGSNVRYAFYCGLVYAFVWYRSDRRRKLAPHRLGPYHREDVMRKSPDQKNISFIHPREIAKIAP